MTSKQRFLKVLAREIPDRLPVTTHHVMPYFLQTVLGGISDQKFFERFGLDPILWVVANRPDGSRGETIDPEQGELEFLEPPHLCSDNWRIRREERIHADYRTIRYTFVTPKKSLFMILQSNEQTSWVVERLIKVKSDIDIFAEYAPMPLCDVDEVNKQTDAFRGKGMVRGAIPGFDAYGQPGCWQDAAVLFGIENLILETFDDPAWVHAFLRILTERKKYYARSMRGARFDLVELGGGDASTTVISPKLFETFVAPCDAEIIDEARRAGQRIVYHTCGGMMPILESIAEMNPDAMESFTPPGIGGDVNLVEAKKKIGDRVCMIGGFDQFHHLKGCSPEETRRAVRRCFEQAGEGGGYILAPSDHFFEADIECLEAYGDEARKCLY